MFVCLCLGLTTRDVTRAVERGACTSRQVASMCGAGSDCGRCRPTVRSIIASTGPVAVSLEEVAPADHVPAAQARGCLLRASRGNRVDSSVHAV